MSQILHRKSLTAFLKLALAFVMAFFICGHQASAVRDASPIATDSRIRIMVYHPDDVFKYTGYYNYQTSIEFATDETIENISMGDSTAWQIVPQGHRLFLKPVEQNATTNMTIITNKRTYLFELYAQEAIDIRDPNLAFNIRFVFPDEQREALLQNIPNNSALDLSEAEKYNFNYLISGSDHIAPISIFDDGRFTYMEFTDRNGQIPAIFSVEHDLRESIVNFHRNGKYIVIERVYHKMALKLGSKVTCVYNEAYYPK